MTLGGVPNIDDQGRDGFSIEHLIDRLAAPGRYAFDLALGNHSIRIIDDTTGDRAECDGFASPVPFHHAPGDTDA